MVFGFGVGAIYGLRTRWLYVCADVISNPNPNGCVGLMGERVVVNARLFLSFLAVAAPRIPCGEDRRPMSSPDGSVKAGSLLTGRQVAGQAAARTLRVQLSITSYDKDDMFT